MWWNKLFTWIRTLLSVKGKKGLVIIIPGLFGLNRNLVRLVKIIKGWDYEVEIIPKRINPNWKIEKVSEELANYIKSKEASKLFLIGHSKGGLVARYLIEHDKDIDQVTINVFTIATPHRGTVWGLIPLEYFNQFDPGGDFLINLNKGNNYKKVVNFYAKIDTKIVPTENAILEGAINYKIDVVGHTKIIKSDELVGYLKKFLVT